MQAKLAARGFDIEECSWLNPVDNVWSVHVRNRACHLMFTNGKGATKLAAHASALGEYFERLSCNYFWNHYYLGEQIANRSFTHYPRERWFPLTADATDWPAELLTPELQAFYNPEGSIPAETLVDMNSGNEERGICAIPYVRQRDGAEVFFPVNIISPAPRPTSCEFNPQPTTFQDIPPATYNTLINKNICLLTLHLVS
jgi:ribosomal protein S12 methylthiotransferase accessory factor